MPRYTIIAVMSFLLVLTNPFKAGHGSSTSAVASWPIEAMQAWGSGNIAVDFGDRGLWNYSGAWIQMTRLNPRHMEAWGDNRLAVDLGPHGLWIFDGHAWEKIS